MFVSVVCRPFSTTAKLFASPWPAKSIQRGTFCRIRIQNEPHFRLNTVNNPPKNIDSNSLGAKRISRAPKKTVLTIAPADTIDDPVEECSEESRELAQSAFSIGSNPESRRRPQTHLAKFVTPKIATDFSCKAMAIALHGRSFATRIEPNDPLEHDLQGILDALEEMAGLPLDGTTAVERLKSLLNVLNHGALAVRERANAECDEHAKSTLVHAIHLVLSAHCQRGRFEDAVEQVSQRAIYQFAYGLTHEINNPLANIAARAQQLIANASSDSDRRSLATIVDQSMRAHEMLSEMMRVVQPNPIQTRVEDVIGIVRKAIEIQEKQWTHSQVQCNLKGCSKTLHCAIDPSAMVEAIGCLLHNAFQVCRPNDRIEVVCEELDPSHPDFGPLPPMLDGQQKLTPRIRIAVRDTGPGMSQDAVERAWDLYFSGREHGRGLGISLAKVRRTVDAHQGLVWMESKPHAGCTVEIRLPKRDDPTPLRKSFSI